MGSRQRLILLAGAAVFALAFHAAQAGKFNRVLDIGDPAPAWENLPGVDGRQHSLADLADARIVVIAFTCNHCPVAQSYQERFKEFARKYKPKGVELVAISVNLEPADGLEKMKERAAEQEYNFPYLQDPTQQIGRKYGATSTPHLFVLDKQRRIAYMGAFDDDFSDASAVQEHYVRDAVEALLAGQEPEITETRQSGCPIRYESGPGD